MSWKWPSWFHEHPSKRPKPSFFNARNQLRLRLSSGSSSRIVRTEALHAQLPQSARLPVPQDLWRALPQAPFEAHLSEMLLGREGRRTIGSPWTGPQVCLRCFCRRPNLQRSAGGKLWAFGQPEICLDTSWFLLSFVLCASTCKTALIRGVFQESCHKVGPSHLFQPHRTRQFREPVSPLSASLRSQEPKTRAAKRGVDRRTGAADAAPRRSYYFDALEVGWKLKAGLRFLFGFPEATHAGLKKKTLCQVACCQRKPEGIN